MRRRTAMTRRETRRVCEAHTETGCALAGIHAENRSCRAGAHGALTRRIDPSNVVRDWRYGAAGDALRDRSHTRPAHAFRSGARARSCGRERVRALLLMGLR